MLPQDAGVLTIGARVSVAATYFDIPNEPRWSQANFPADWRTARVIGTILRKHKTGFWVRFDDGDEQCIGIEDLELHGDTLARAAQRMGAGDGGHDHEAGPSGHAVGSSDRITRSRRSLSTDDNAPLAALLFLARTERSTPRSAPHNASVCRNPSRFRLLTIVLCMQERILWVL